MKIRELIQELLEFNLDATVNIRDMYSDSESINFSWIADDSDDGTDSRKCTSHLFLEGCDVDEEREQ